MEVMSCHVCAAEAAGSKQTRDGVHGDRYIMFVHDIHKHRDKRRDQPAAAKELLLNNKRLNLKALHPSRRLADRPAFANHSSS
jgi:hypothetical protein